MKSVVLWIGEFQNSSNLMGNFPQLILSEGNSYKGIFLSCPPHSSNCFPKYFPHTVKILINNGSIAGTNFHPWDQVFGGLFVTSLLTPFMSDADPSWTRVDIFQFETFTLYFTEAWNLMLLILCLPDSNVKKLYKIQNVRSQSFASCLY